MCYRKIENFHDFAKVSLNIRSNIRYDRIDAYKTPAYRPFSGSKNQILFSLDFIFPF